MRAAVLLLALAVTCVTEDRNADGKPDTWKYSEGKRTVRTERDTDHDGRPDVFTQFLKGRHLILKSSDTDRDGRIDKRTLEEWQNDRKIQTGFENGRARYTYMPGYVPLWTEKDADGDGLIDSYKERGRAKPERDRMGKSITEEVKL